MCSSRQLPCPCGSGLVSEVLWESPGGQVVTRSCDECAGFKLGIFAADLPVRQASREAGFFASLARVVQDAGSVLVRRTVIGGAL